MSNQNSKRRARRMRRKRRRGWMLPTPTSERQRSLYKGLRLPKIKRYHRLKKRGT